MEIYNVIEIYKCKIDIHLVKKIYLITRARMYAKITINFESVS